MILQQNKKARKQRAFNLHNLLLFKEVPPTGLEPVCPCGQQILRQIQNIDTPIFLLKNDSWVTTG